MKTKIYELAGRKFYVGDIKNAQLAQLQEHFDVPADAGTKILSADFFKEFEGNIAKMCLFIAIIVQEEGVKLKDKKIDEIKELFLYELDPAQLLEMVTIFTVPSDKNSDGLKPESKTENNK